MRNNIYNPPSQSNEHLSIGPYQYSALAALAYLIPLVDASDLGKYMFEAYPLGKEALLHPLP